MTPYHRRESSGLLEKMERIEGLVAELDHADSPIAESARELAKAMLDLHRAGFERVLQRLAEAGEAGRNIGELLADDDLVGALLVLHNLHPVPLADRVGQALDRLRAQGCDAEILQIEGGAVKLRLAGDCHLPFGAVQALIEQALTAAVPDVESIEFETESGKDIDGYFPLPIISGQYQP